jgi:hypothetical protein
MREDGRGNEEEMGGEAKQTCIIVPEKARRGWPPDDAALGCFGAVACRSRLSCLFLISAAVSRATSSSHSVAPQLASLAGVYYLSVSNFSFPSPMR